MIRVDDFPQDLGSSDQRPLDYSRTGAANSAGPLVHKVAA